MPVPRGLAWRPTSSAVVLEPDLAARRGEVVPTRCHRPRGAGRVRFPLQLGLARYGTLDLYRTTRAVVSPAVDDVGQGEAGHEVGAMIQAGRKRQAPAGATGQSTAIGSTVGQRLTGRGRRHAVDQTLWQHTRYALASCTRVITDWPWGSHRGRWASWTGVAGSRGGRRRDALLVTECSSTSLKMSGSPASRPCSQRWTDWPLDAIASCWT